MAEVEDSTTWVYMGIHLMNVLGNRGVCRDTTRGCRTFVELHTVVGVCVWEQETQDRDMFTGLCRFTGKLGSVCQIKKNERQRNDEISAAFFDSVRETRKSSL